MSNTITYRGYIISTELHHQVVAGKDSFHCSVIVHNNFTGESESFSAQPSDGDADAAIARGQRIGKDFVDNKLGPVSE